MLSKASPQKRNTEAKRIKKVSHLIRARAYTGARVSAALRELLNFTLAHVSERRTFGNQTLIEGSGLVIQ